MRTAIRKPGKTSLRLLSIVVVGLALLSGSRMWTKVKASDAPDFNIYLASTTFDPLAYVPAAPHGLSMNSTQAIHAGLYLVQFNGPVLEEWKQQLVSAGAQLGPYLPEYSFVVKVDPSALATIQALAFVRWVGPFQPGYKLAPSVDGSLPRSYNVTLAPWADMSQMQSMARGIDSQAKVFSQDLLVVLDAATLNQMAFRPDVLWIEPYQIRETNNNIAGGTIMNGSTAWANGYTGSGVTVAVMDTGLDTGTPASMHSDFMNGTTARVTHIKSYPVLPYTSGSCSVTNPGADDGAADVESGHGTHVTGSVAGNGARSSGNFKGLAYNASIVFQAVEQYTTFTSGCGLSNGYYLMGIPDDVRPLFTEIYNWGARVQNDSWGGGSPGVYDQQAAYFDDFIFNHPDFTITVAAGNAGVDGNRNGYVDDGSVNSPGTAKNVITVGASENERTSSTCSTGGVSGYTGCSYFQLWGSNYPTNPTRSDIISNNRGQMAAFSSRGPTVDNRIRPDVVAPGTDIISTRSSRATETGWGAYNAYYESMGGTSMASPLTSGAAAVVRDFLIHHQSIADPSAALVKATLINTAVDIPGYGNSSYEAGAPIPNNSEGWGRVDVGAATASNGRWFLDGASLSPGASFDNQYAVAAGLPFKVTLVWSDYPAAASAGVTLVNDLNLKLTAPNGTTTYWGNTFSGGWSATGGSADNRNNVENVYIQVPTPGLWRVQVIAQNVPHGPQPYALVMSGHVSCGTCPGDFNKTSPANISFNLPANPTLTWGSSTNVVSYEYCIDTINNGICDTSWISTNTATSIALSGLTNRTWFWQVHAINTHGATEANAGTWWSFLVGPPHQVYMPLILHLAQGQHPGSFTKSGPDNGITSQPANPTLSWSASSTALSYEYCLVTGIDSACSGTWISVDANTSVGLSNLTPGSTYSWQVRAFNTSGYTQADAGTWWTFSTASAPASGIANAGFENGSDGAWTEYSIQDYAIISQAELLPVTPHNGSYAAWLGGSNDETSSIEQSISISAGAHYLVYWQWIVSWDTCDDPLTGDFGKVLVNGLEIDSYQLCDTTSTPAWVTHSIDLSAYAGQTVSLQIRAETDSADISSLVVDDISLQASAGAAASLPGIPALVHPNIYAK